MVCIFGRRIFASAYAARSGGSSLAHQLDSGQPAAASSRAPVLRKAAGRPHSLIR